MLHEGVPICAEAQGPLGVYGGEGVASPRRGIILNSKCTGTLVRSQGGEGGGLPGLSPGLVSWHTRVVGPRSQTELRTFMSGITQCWVKTLLPVLPSKTVLPS